MPGSHDNSPILSELLQEDPTFLDLVELFVQGLPDRIGSMQEALSRKDFATLRSLSHQLKGSGGGHGFACLTATAAVLEEGARATDTDTCQRQINELKQYLPRIQAALASA